MAGRYRFDWITRRRYLAYVGSVSLAGGLFVGYLLGGEHTLPALAVAGVAGVALVLPKVLAERPLFDERDRRMDERAARYTMLVVTALALPALAGPVVLEQLGIVPFQDWMLLVGLVLTAEVYLFVGIVFVLNYRS